MPTTLDAPETTPAFPLLMLLKYVGRSATMRLQFGVLVVSTIIIEATEIPGPVGVVPRSPSTHSVTRLAAGTLIDIIFVPPIPLSGCVKYCMFTWQFVCVGLPSVRN